MDTTAIAVLAPCSLIALIVVVITLKPSAAHAVSEVLAALAGVLASINPWAKTGPATVKPAPEPGPVVPPDRVSPALEPTTRTRDV